MAGTCLGQSPADMQQSKMMTNPRELSEKNRWSVMVDFTHMDRLYHIPRRNASHIITRGKKEKVMHIDLIVLKAIADHRNHNYHNTAKWRHFLLYMNLAFSI